MTVRRSLSSQARARVFLGADGRCHVCTRKIAPGEEWEVEHVVPLSMGGADTPANMHPAHRDCHRPKTAAEARVRAKADRAGKAHAGLKRKSRMAGSRGSGWKIKMNRTVERRT